MKYFSMFSGIGGFEYGIERCVGFPQIEEGQIPSEDEESLSNPRSPNGAWGKQRAVCIGYSEVDKYAESIYKYHFPSHINWGDATKIKTETLPEFDLLVGGFPSKVSIHRKLRQENLF